MSTAAGSEMSRAYVEYCEVCYETLDETWQYSKCPDCHAFADQEYADGEELPEDSGEASS